MLALALLFAALAATACGERSEPVSGKLSVYPVEVRGAGDVPAELTERPERIAVLDPGAAELLAELGVGDRLVGVPSGVSIPEAAGAVELTRPSGLVDVDALEDIDADLVVASPDNDTEEVGRVLRRSPAALYLAPDNSLDDVIRATLELGLLVGEPVRAREVAAGLRRQIDEVTTRVEGPAAEDGLRATRGCSSPFRRTASWPTSSATRAASSWGPRRPGTPIEPCDLIRLDPDVVLTYDDAPEIQTYDFPECLDAGIPEGADIDADLVTQAGPRVGEALEQVARILHPDAFE